MSSDEKMQEFRRNLGSRLRQARNAKGLSLEQVAKLIFDELGLTITPSRISNYEQGTRLPDPLMVQIFAQAYGTYPSVLYGFGEAPSDPSEAKLLDRYRRTDERGRAAIYGVAESQPVYDPAER